MGHWECFLNVKVRPTAICVGQVCRMTTPLFDTLKWTENTKHALIQYMRSQTENGNSEDLDNMRAFYTRQPLLVSAKQLMIQETLQTG